MFDFAHDHEVSDVVVSFFEGMTVVYEKQIRRSKRRQRFWKSLFTVGQSVSVGYSMISYYLKSETSSSTFWWIARVVLMLVSMASFLLWSLARYQLGASLTFLAKTDGPFITTGLYSKIRNPIYLFGTVSMSSYLLLINKPEWLLLLFVVVPMQIIRSNQETKVLRKKYDELYENYERKLWF